MVSVQHVTAALLKEKPFVHEALRRGIINHAALAEELRPEIERALGRDVTFSAVNMSIRRLSERLAERQEERVLFAKDADVSVRSHLVELVLYKSDAVQARIKKLYGAVDFRHGGFLTVTQGIDEIMIVTNEKHLAHAKRILPRSSMKRAITGLSSVTAKLSPRATNAAGFFYTVTRAFAWENVNIVDVVSTYTELTFIVSEQQTGKAFDILTRLITR